jgi:hypothetical protein
LKSFSLTEKDAEKPSVPPFDRLRANGMYPEIVGIFPFMLSLSKHGKPFSAT